jgi:hypothetical protein
MKIYLYANVCLLVSYCFRISMVTFSLCCQPTLRAADVSMAMDRRELVQGAAILGGALIGGAPAFSFVGGGSYDPTSSAGKKPKMAANEFAPVISVFDGRGCPRGVNPGEYSGEKSGDINDDMAVKVVLQKVSADEDYAALIKSETLTRLNDVKKVEINKSRL